ncbi:MAG: HEPN domain-containing protein [Bacillota bacterium]
MDKVTDSVINEMAAVVAREVKPEAIVLFGSYATGKNRPDSDIDLLIIGFHAQQAVEKSVKAWLSLLNIEYPRTHDLSFLFALLIEADSSAATFKNLTEFTPYALQFRYETY